MKKLFIGLLSVVMAVSTAFSLGAYNSDGAYETTARADAPTTVETKAYDNSVYGINFKADKYAQYDTSKTLQVPPKTITAEIRIPSNAANRTGIILGCYKSNNYEYNFEIQGSGSGDSLIRYPKIFHVANGSSGQFNFEFKQVDLAENTNYTLTVVHDTQNATAHCYVNGELKQSITVTDTSKYSTYVKSGEYAYTVNKTFRVGGDYRDTGKTNENGTHFQGWIKSITAYSDVRTATEVKADYQRKSNTYFYDDNLLLAYDFTQPGEDLLKDLSGNGNNLVATKDVYASNMDGMAFGYDDSYAMNKKITEIPNTFEAYLYLPENYTTRAGIIASNYTDGSSTCVSFEVHNNGMPKLYYDYAKYGVTNVNFTGVSVALGRWVHVAIVHDTAKKTATLYLDGEETMKLEDVVPGDSKALNDPAYSAFEYECDKPLIIGGDYRTHTTPANAQYFQGLIHSVALYSDVRTQAEIKADMQGADVQDKNLMAYYELAGHNGNETIYDLSGNGYDIGAWIPEEKVEDVTDYDYSFAVVGDTQIVAERYAERMGDIYNWIVDNKDDKKIAHVFGLGDITNGSTDAEWTVAKNAISKMDGKLSYSLVRGNHDGSDKYNSNMATTAYTSQFQGFYDGKIENSYTTIKAGEVDYLLITLDYGASDDVLAWAGNLCEQFPNHKVIVSTHAYLYRDGTTLDQSDVCPPATTGGSNNGDHIWDKFASKYGNVFLVLSGHDPCEKLVTTQTKGIHGNTVTQMLIDPQGFDVTEGATGMVAMLYFKGDDVTVRWYSTVREAYYKADNQYAVAIPANDFDAHYYECFPIEANIVTPATETTHAVYVKSCVCGKLSDATDTFEYCADRHLYNQKVVADEFMATPAKNGAHATYYYSCICGAVGEATFEVCDEINHVYKEKVSTLTYQQSPATETAHAVYYYSCLCGAKGEETYRQCNGNHVYEEVVEPKYLVSVANCRDRAVYYLSCLCGKTSGETFEYGDVTDDHVYDRKVVSSATFVSPATCTSKPTYKYSCVCGAIGEQTFSYGYLLEHEFTKEIADDKYLASKATCQASATYYYVCECGTIGNSVYSYGQPDLNAHLYEKKITTEYVATEATCQAPATYYYVCKCGTKSQDTYSYGKLAPHDYDVKTVDAQHLASPASCLSPATYYYACSCGAIGSSTFENGNASGVHAYDMQVATDNYLATPATCTEKATYYYSCECGAKGAETFTYGSLSNQHVYDKQVANDQTKATDATCAKKATYYYTCECGAKGASTFEYGKFTAHDYNLRSTADKYLATEATCTAYATYYFSCECGAKGDNAFEAGITAPHAYSEQVASERYLASTATCTKKATYYYSCECGAKGEKTFEDGELAGHVYDKLNSAKPYLATTATCTAPATYYYSCKCGALGEETYEDGKALGHAYNEKHDCVDKNCVRCDYVSQATASHEYDGGKVSKPATVGAEGVRTYTCKKCNATKTEKIDKLEDGTTCASVYPVGGNMGGGGTAMFILSAFAVSVILLLKKKRSVR